MNAILQYTLYHLTWSLLSAEVAIMLFACLAISLIKIYTNWNAAKNAKSQKVIQQSIDKALFHEDSINSLQIPSQYNHFRNVVAVLEKYDHRLSDPSWYVIKERIVKEQLLPKIDKMAGHRRWDFRQFAARACYLTPQLAPAALLQKLLHDSRYLVRVVSAMCITKIHNKSLFFDMIHQMSKEYTISRFSYRDGLIEAEPEKFRWIEELLATHPEPPIAAICLDILSTRLSHNMFPLFKEFVTSQDGNCRKLAIKALGNLPTVESAEILLEHVHDTDWEIRAESIRGLSKLYVTSAIDKITTLLTDPVWWVRLQAAIALKRFGPKGEAILEEQKNGPSQSAEISHYVLSLPPSAFVTLE
jgi:HEAT repeat protein